MKVKKDSTDVDPVEAAVPLDKVLSRDAIKTLRSDCKQLFTSLLRL